VHSAVAQVHKDGRSPVHHAAIYGVVETVQLLMQRDVDADTPTADGKTPVLLAAVEGHADIVRLLADYGCDVNRVYEDAMTPLSAAASGQHLRAMNGQYTARTYTWWCTSIMFDHGWRETFKSLLTGCLNPCSMPVTFCSWFAKRSLSEKNLALG